MSPVKIAKLLQVVHDGVSEVPRLFIDGQLFEYATVSGFSVHPQRTEMPGVTVTIAGERVDVLDSLDKVENVNAKYLGRHVRVTLDNNEPVVEGVLLSYGNGGEFVIRDTDGFVHRCWPMLKIEEIEDDATR